MFFENIFGQAYRSSSNETDHVILHKDDTSLIFDNRNVSSPASSALDTDFETRDCLIFDRASIIKKHKLKTIKRVPSIKNSNSLPKSLNPLQLTDKTRLQTSKSLIFQNSHCNVESSTSCMPMKSSSISTCIGHVSRDQCHCDVCKHIAFEHLKSKCYVESIHLAQKYCSCFCKDCENRKKMIVCQPFWLDETGVDWNEKEKLENKIKTMEQMLTLKIQIDTIELLLQKQSSGSLHGNEVESEQDSITGIPNRRDMASSESVHIENKNSKTEANLHEIECKFETKESTCQSVPFLSDVQVDQNLVEKCTIIRHLKQELGTLEKLNSEDDIIFKSILQQRIEKLGDNSKSNFHGQRWTRINQYVSQFKSFDERDRQVLLIIWERVKTKLKR